jgi:HAD superfamily hydrolase (TIGR01549 family)
MPITTLFLDAGGVLVVPNWQRVSEALASHGVAIDAATLEAADPYARRDLDLGAGKNASDRQRGWLYFNLVLGHAGASLSAKTDAALADLQAYHSAQNLWEWVPTGVPQALEELRTLGLKLVVVSNANGKLRMLMERIDLARRVDLMLDSSEEGVEKPDPRLFQIAMERSGALADRTLHVGDLFHVDVEGARGAGLQAMLLDPLDLYGDFDCERVHSLGELAVKMRTTGTGPGITPS